jgi:hypothetical protein
MLTGHHCQVDKINAPLCILYIILLTGLSIQKADDLKIIKIWPVLCPLSIPFDRHFYERQIFLDLKKMLIIF